MAVAAPGLQILHQRSFEAGAYPQNEVIPDNGCEDIINGLVDEDGSIYRRGGSLYKGNQAGSATQHWVFGWDGYLAAGQRTVFGRGDGKFYVLDAAGTTWVDVTVVSASTYSHHRPVVVNGALIFAPSGGDATTGPVVRIWGGARSNMPSNLAATVTVTNGSKTVTGTLFTTNAEPGTILRRDASPIRFGVVETVNSATQLTLAAPWQGPTETATYWLSQSPSSQPASGKWATMLSGGPTTYLASMFDRLIIAQGNRIAFTAAGDPLNFADPNDYHELPVGAQVVGLEPLRDQLLVFTTQGVFTLTGLAFDLTDAQGNTQQRLERTNPEMVLRHAAGIGGWRGAIVAPASDDIYLIDSAAAMKPIAGGIRRLWRSYMLAQYFPGQATVIREHYILPVRVSSGAWVDTLVCNLRTGAWTRWSGHGGASQVFVRSNVSTVDARLYMGADSSDYRLLDVTNAWNPQAAIKNEADGSTHQLQVTTRSFSLGDRVRRQWRRLWVRYELDDAASDDPTVSLETSEDRVGSSFTSESETGSEGDDGHTWTFSKRSRAIRFRLKSNGPSSNLRLRALEVFVRPSGRR